MKGKQNGKDPLTVKQKDERLHFLIKGTGYILLYGAVLIFVASLVIAIFPNSELGKPFEVAGFILFGLWIIVAFPFILFGKYDRNIFSKIFWSTLYADFKLKIKKLQIKFDNYYKEKKTKK